MLAGVARAVAFVEAARVPVAGAGGPRRRLGVRRTVGARPGAHFRRIALACRPAADRERAQETIRRARGARPGAGLDVVARTRRRPADRPGVPRRVLAGI